MVLKVLPYMSCTYWGVGRKRLFRTSDRLRVTTPFRESYSFRVLSSDKIKDILFIRETFVNCKSLIFAPVITVYISGGVNRRVGVVYNKFTLVFTGFGKLFINNEWVVHPG